MEDQPTEPPAERPSGAADSPTVPEVPVPPAAAPQPPPPWPTWTPAAATKANRVARVLGHRSTGWFVAALLVGVVTGLAVALANTTNGPVRQVIAGGPVQGPRGVFEIPSPGQARIRVVFPRSVNVRIGRVDSVSTSSFTLATASGPTLTIDEQSSTSYRNGARSVTSSAVKKGDEVAVFGNQTGTTVEATQVVVLTLGAGQFFFPG